MTDIEAKVLVWGVFIPCAILSWRSRRRREMGLCCSCGTNPATQTLALDTLCDACARRTAHTYRVGSQFFAFLVVFMLLMTIWMWLEPGSEKLDLPWGQLVMTILGMAAFVVWLRRRPVKKEPSR